MSLSPFASPSRVPPTSMEADRGSRGSRTRQPEWWRVVARAAYLVLTGTAVFVFVFSLPTYDAQLQFVCSGLPSCSFFGQLSRGTLPVFQQAHISVPVYAAAFLALVSLNGLLALIFGIAIVWRLWGKENEMLGLLTSFVMILGGTIATKNGDFAGFAPATPLVLNIVGSLAFLLYWPALAMILLTFPTGRFAPRWTWLLIFLWLIQIGLSILLDFNENSSPLLYTSERLIVYGSSYAVLYWRYRHLYTHTERQQTKWLLYGFVPFSLLYILSGTLEGIPALNTPSSLYLVGEPILEVVSFLIVPIAIGIALLRYRLWDIDVLINRTLVYGLLTATLLGMYLVLVFGGQYLLTSFVGPNNSVVLVVSTLIVAALFQPLRQRVQQLVDRRFYRSKYDAARVMTRFSDTLRQEVNLEQLCGQLLAVVQETVQPTSLSLWLCPREPQEEPGKAGARSPLP